MLNIVFMEREGFWRKDNRSFLISIFEDNKYNDSSSSGHIPKALINNLSHRAHRGRIGITTQTKSSYYRYLTSNLKHLPISAKKAAVLDDLPRLYRSSCMSKSHDVMEMYRISRILARHRVPAIEG